MNGGNITFNAGKASKDVGVDTPPIGRDGDFIFNLANNTEVLRICGNGRFLVEGRPVPPM